MPKAHRSNIDFIYDLTNQTNNLLLIAGKPNLLKTFNAQVTKVETLGETISEARKRAGFTLRNLAPRVPVNFVYLSEIEKDKNTPSSI